MSIDVRTQGWGRSCGLADHHLLDFNRWAKAVQPPRVPHGHVTRSVVASDSALYTPKLRQPSFWCGGYKNIEWQTVLSDFPFAFLD